MKKYILAVVLAGVSLAFAPPNARAALSATLNEFTGDDSSVSVNITENNGGLLFTLNLVSPSTGAITGFWANLNPNADMTGWEATAVSGTIENQVFSAGNVNNIGGGVNLSGGGSPAPMDFGIRFAGGPSGQSSVSFVLEGASLSDFTGSTFAARLQSLPGREGSSKLVGTPNGPGPGPGPGTPVPDASTTVTLLGLSLFGLESLRRRLMKS